MNAPGGSMNPGEAADLLREAATVWTVVRFDQQTALVWARALEPLTFAQAQAGLRAHMRASKEIPTPAALIAAFRGLGTNRTGEPTRPGGPVSKPSCPDCHHGWIECPPIVVRSQPRGDVPATEIRYPEVVKPCPRCLPETHQKWQTGQFGSEANR